MTLPAAPARPGGLDEAWRRVWQTDPAALVLQTDTRAWTRDDFEAAIAARQAAMAGEGLVAGDRLAWLGLNSAEMLAALLACERAGIALVPLNWRLADEELRTILHRAGVRRIHGTPEMAERAAVLGAACPIDRPRGDGADPDLLIAFTSGTSGQPKGARHGAQELRAGADIAIAVQGFGASTRTLSVLPMFHVGGLCIQTLPTILAGGVVRLHARFEPGAWFDDVARWRPETSVLVPAVMRALFDHPAWPAADLSSLRFANSGSSVVPVPFIEAFHARGVPVAQVYGSTETGPFSIALLPDEALARAGLAGRAAPGVDIRLVDGAGAEVAVGEVGEILVRGPNVMRGYLGLPEDPAFCDGWFHSGDLARLDATGNYEVVGRAKDLIISGGENLYPAEIENLLASLPGLAECAVVGVPDDRWGEVPVLAVVPLPGAVLTDEAIRACYEGRLARFKHPRRIVMLDALPKTALGKVRKAALASTLGRGG